VGRLVGFLKDPLRRGQPRDPGVERAIPLVAQWLARAQDKSASADGGVASHVDLDEGWAPSYPETTGYIVPSLLKCARRLGDDSLRDRARRMLDWLVSIQHAEGSFRGGRIGVDPTQPVTFNTGQILIGFAAGYEEFGTPYEGPMRRAADWLVATQDEDGGWSAFPSPLTAPGSKSYEIHTSMGLFEASRVADNDDWRAAALSNVDWALGLQRESGWFDACDHAHHEEPLTHTIGYTLRTVVEAHAVSGEQRYLRAAKTTADALLGVIGADGFIPGRLDADWQGAVPWACLTGSCQIAESWFMLYERTGHEPYRDAAVRANRYVRQTLRPGGPKDFRGGVFGSNPPTGNYCRNQQINWAAKFFLDSHLLEERVMSGG
jgi:hypothetical protein